MAEVVHQADSEPIATNSSTARTPLLSPDNASTSSIWTTNASIYHKHDTTLEDNTVAETSTLGRKIGWSSAYILVISRVIGSGIFAMPGVIVQDVGSPGLALSLWLVGALVAWAGLAISIEYGAMLPRSGGIKVYLEYTYRWPRFLASTMIAVHAVLLGFTASNCIIFAKYLLFATNTQPTDLTTKAMAVGLLTTITMVHCCFYKTGIYVQNALGWVKIALTVVMILTGFVVLVKNREPLLPWDEFWVDSNWELNTLSTAFFKILYSFAGLENVNNVMNEVRNPIRTIKSVGPAGLLTACVMYVLINVAYLAVVPLDQVKQSRELIAALFFERVGFGRTLLPVAIALSAAGNVMVVTFSLARLNQEIARQGFLPYSRVLASTRPFGSPMGGLFVHYFPSVLVIVLPPSASVYSFIAEVEGYAGQFYGLATAVGLVLLRYNKPDLHRPFKAWLPAVWLRVVLAVLLIAAPLFPPSHQESRKIFYAAYAVVGISVLGFGLVYWFVWIIVLPYYRGYVLDEQDELLVDGTRITRLVRKVRDTVHE